MKIKNIKKVFAVLPLLILASCTGSNNSPTVSDLDEDIVNTGEVAEVSSSEETSNDETLNENIQKAEVTRGSGFGGKQYRGGDTNSRAS